MTESQIKVVRVMAWVVLASLLLGVYNLLTYAMLAQDHSFDRQIIAAQQMTQKFVWDKSESADVQQQLAVEGYEVEWDEDEHGPYIYATRAPDIKFDIFSHRIHILIRFESDLAAAWHVYVSGKYF